MKHRRATALTHDRWQAYCQNAAAIDITGVIHRRRVVGATDVFHWYLCSLLMSSMNTSIPAFVEIHDHIKISKVKLAHLVVVGSRQGSFVSGWCGSYSKEVLWHQLFGYFWLGS